MAIDTKIKGVIVTELKKYKEYKCKCIQLKEEIANRRSMLASKGISYQERSSSYSTTTEIDLIIEVDRKELLLLEYHERIVKLDTVLSYLTEDHSKIIKMFYIDGDSITKIADSISYSIRSVERHKSNALEKMAQLWQF